jgi:hypothetical protein
MRASLRARLVILAVVFLPALLTLWLYVSTRDWEYLFRQYELGHKPTWPPRTKPGSSPEILDGAPQTPADIAQVIALVAAGVLLLTAVATLRRVVERRRRARATIRWELRLGRDDLANPYRVQEMFEGIAGAIRSRWYERVWRGCDHFAVEIHWLPDQSIRFAIAGPMHLGRAIKGPLEDLYPDVEMDASRGGPDWGQCVVRLKKRRPFVLSIQTNRNYEHAFAESLVAVLSAHDHETTVQLVLTPAPGLIDRRARRLLKRRERALQHADHRDHRELGIDSVVEAKELKGALELQHRSLLYFDLRVIGRDPTTVKRVAGLFSQLRSENELSTRYMWLRRRLYARRTELALPNPIPGWRTGVLSTSELATIWQLPRARVKHARLARATVRRAIAPPEIQRDPDRMLLRDERGPVSIAPNDRKYGHALIGGQGGGKSSVMARHFANDVRDPNRAVILIDPKGPLAELCLGIAAKHRTVHYLDLGHPEVGINPLAIHASAGARAAVFLQALIEANPAGAIQAASDSFLRQAIYAVCLAEPEPTLWHVYRMLDVRESDYREIVLERMQGRDEADFARAYWANQFPDLLADRGYAVQALNPPRNKLERLISTREIDTLLRHPAAIDLDAILEGSEVLIVAGAKATVGEDNTVLVTQLLLQLLHRALQARQNLPRTDQHRVSLLIDEAHNVLTPSVAKMLAEGRSAGLEAVFAWQYSAQIRDEVIRSGVRSLLQSLSIFRMREMEDARALAGLAMEVYSDRISVDQEEQERLRFSPDDIVKLPTHRAINVWVADDVPRGGFLGETVPMEELRRDELAEHHLEAQRQRGGHHPGHLPDPLRDLLNGNATADSRNTASRRSAKRRHVSGRPSANATNGDRDKEQLTFIDVTEFGDRDDL